MLCCVDMRMSGSLKKLDVSVPNPECLVGFESLGGGEGEGMSRGLWLRLRDSSRRVRAFPSLLGGEDCIACSLVVSRLRQAREQADLWVYLGYGEKMLRRNCWSKKTTTNSQSSRCGIGRRGARGESAMRN